MSALIAILWTAYSMRAHAFTCSPSRVAVPKAGVPAPTDVRPVVVVEGVAQSAALRQVNAGPDAKSMSITVERTITKDGGFTYFRLTPLESLRAGALYEVVVTLPERTVIGSVFTVEERQPDTVQPEAPKLGVARIEQLAIPALGIVSQSIVIPVSAPGADYLEVFVDGQLDSVSEITDGEIVLGPRLGCQVSDVNIEHPHRLQVVAFDTSGNGARGTEVVLPSTGNRP